MSKRIVLATFVVASACGGASSASRSAAVAPVRAEANSEEVRAERAAEPARFEPDSPDVAAARLVERQLDRYAIDAGPAER